MKNKLQYKHSGKSDHSEPCMKPQSNSKSNTLVNSLLMAVSNTLVNSLHIF